MRYGSQSASRRRSFTLPAPLDGYDADARRLRGLPLVVPAWFRLTFRVDRGGLPSRLPASPDCSPSALARAQPAGVFQLRVGGGIISRSGGGGWGCGRQPQSPGTRVAGATPATRM